MRPTWCTGRVSAISWSLEQQDLYAFISRKQLAVSISKYIPQVAGNIRELQVHVHYVITILR